MFTYMDDPQTPDEKSKRQLAKKVIAAKRKYFIPKHGLTVEAESVDDAVTKAQELHDSQSTEDSDGK